MKKNYFLWQLIFLFILFANSMAEGQISISNRLADNVVVFGNGKLKVTLDYASKCVVTGMEVSGEAVLSDKSGIYSGIRTSAATYSTLKLTASPNIKTQKNSVTISGIHYGEDNEPIDEVWTFLITETDIRFDIERTVSKPIVAEEVSFPAFNFDSINTWNAAFLGNGGVAWFYLFNERLCTYGVHTDFSAFWNDKKNIGLKINTSAEGKQIASKYSRSYEDKLVYSISVSDKELVPRYDPDTKRRRFIRQKTDVWDSFTIKAGKYNQTITLTPTDYSVEYNRGKFVGVDGDKITNLLNTVARIGVIDSKLFGSNSWHTPYGPICLQEHWIGQLGLAINDQNYINGYKECLNYYRDNAVKPDGRVFARWAYDNSDMMPGEVTPLGFYEAQWGYAFDSNTDLTTNICELYNLCGDTEWVRTHKKSCETTLEYLLKRDSNKNNLVEVMTNYHSEKKSSDWHDIMWASFETALINAKLYRALTLWSDVEKQLGDNEKALYFADYAAKLKNSFNKNIEEGGFWDSKNKWYVHWRDKDNSIHGNNLATSVNFMAIAYGICDYTNRSNDILNKIESQMKMENLFFWPLCLYPYQTDEGLDYQFPFPYYENGDLFLSWGGVGVESYAKINPDLALKYVENVLTQYDKDGLAFQRYSRISQKGEGDDILAGNCLSVIGLYKAIYGINPLYNRLYLNPHLPAKLSGTELIYHFRNEKLKIGLATNNYSVSNDQFKITSKKDFGFYSNENELCYFNSRKDEYSLKAQLLKTGNLSVEIVRWNEKECTWNQITSPNTGKITYSACRLKAESKYSISINGQIFQTLRSDKEGRLEFDVNAKTNSTEISIQLLKQ